MRTSGEVAMNRAGRRGAPPRKKGRIAARRLSVLAIVSLMAGYLVVGSTPPAAATTTIPANFGTLSCTSWVNAIAPAGATGAIFTITGGGGSGGDNNTYAGGSGGRGGTVSGTIGGITAGKIVSVQLGCGGAGGGGNNVPTGFANGGKGGSDSNTVGYGGGSTALCLATSNGCGGGEIVAVAGGGGGGSYAVGAATNCIGAKGGDANVGSAFSADGGIVKPGQDGETRAACSGSPSSLGNGGKGGGASGGLGGVGLPTGVSATGGTTGRQNGGAGASAASAARHGGGGGAGHTGGGGGGAGTDSGGWSTGGGGGGGSSWYASALSQGTISGQSFGQASATVNTGGCWNSNFNAANAGRPGAGPGGNGNDGCGGFVTMDWIISASAVSFTSQPTATATPNENFSTQPIVNVTAGGTPYAGLTVTLAIKPGTGSTGAVLSCSSLTAVTDASGNVAFSNCRIDRAGSGYQLRATSDSAIGDTSAFDVRNGTNATITTSSCGVYQTLTIPKGAISATASLTGGGGGGGGADAGSNFAGPGGSGGTVARTVNLATAQPGTNSTSVVIGCGGGGGTQTGASGNGGTSAYGAGGAGGGGNSHSGAGGGASAFCLGSGSCTTPLVVASGGGGGGAIWRCCAGQDPTGGTGGSGGNGTPDGSNGTNGGSASSNGGGGGGATQAANGSAGTGGGGNGSAGSGTAGGAGAGSGGCVGGGGGGGGYRGGGGGACGNGTLSEAGGAGGAGSSYAAAGPGAPTYSSVVTNSGSIYSTACGRTTSACSTNSSPGRGGRGGPTNNAGYAGEAGTAAISWQLGGASLVMTTQPPTVATAGTGFGFAATVNDINGAVVRGDSMGTATVTLNPGAGCGPIAQSGTVNYDPSTGVITVSGIRIEKACAATSTIGISTLDNTSGLTLSATTGTFTTVPASASELVVTPASATGQASATANIGAYTVVRQDAYNNPTTTPNSVTTVNLSSNSSGTRRFGASAGATCTSSCSVTIPANASSATFWYGDSKSGSWTLTTSATGLTSGTATAVVTPAAVHHLRFDAQPSNPAAVDTALGNVKVQVVDEFENVVTTATNSITFSVAAGTPTSGAGTGLTSAALLSGTTTKAAVAGEVIVSDLKIGRTGFGYKLTATGASVPNASVDSSAFDVVVFSATGATIPLTSNAEDPTITNNGTPYPGSGVATVSYYYCTGLSGACTNGTSIGSSNSGPTFQVDWTPPSAGSYRVVSVMVDKVGNTSAVTAATPVKVG